MQDQEVIWMKWKPCQTINLYMEILQMSSSSMTFFPTILLPASFILQRNLMSIDLYKMQNLSSRRMCLVHLHFLKPLTMPGKNKDDLQRTDSIRCVHMHAADPAVMTKRLQKKPQKPRGTRTAHQTLQTSSLSQVSAIHV